MKNIGNSILPSSCPEILRPLKFRLGTLQVRPNEPLDTHELILTESGVETIVASHPNGYSCRSLAERLIAGNSDRVFEQADYIVRCGGDANHAIILLACLKEQQ